MSAKMCPQCGFEIIKNANYCFNCGLALKFPMPEIKYLNTEVSETENEFKKPIPTGIENIDTPDNSIIELPDNDTETEGKQAFQSPDNDESATPEDCEEQQPQECDGDDMNFEADNHESVKDSEQIESNDNEDSAERKGIRILGMSEGVFYTTLLAIGISAVVVFKWINDPDWLRASSNDDKPLIDTSIVNTLQKDAITDSTSNNVTEFSSLGNESTSIDTEKTNPIPNPSGTDSDSAYHVVISALKDIEHARQVASSVKYPDTHIISDEKIHKVAVFHSLRKEDAKLYMDSVVKKEAQ